MENIYPYAVAKIKVKENRLLSNTNLDALATEKNIERIVSILREKEYDFDIVSRYEDYEIVLKKAEEDLYKLMKEILEEKDILEIFLSQNDYYNIKLILKSKIQKKPYQQNLLEGGTMTTEKIIEIMESGEYDRFDKNVKEAIQQATEIYGKTNMPFTIDVTLDKACFGKMKELAQKIGNKFILEYVTKLIDITNIKTFFRIRKTYKDISIFEKSYMEGGKIKRKTFMDNFQEDEQNLKYQFIGFSDIIDKAVNHYENLDKFCDNYIMHYMKGAKLLALTIEPIVAYIYAKQTEFKNIRIIFTGKLNHIPKEKIKERLRESYV